MSEPFVIPTYLTHYYSGLPFRTLTELTAPERARVVEASNFPKDDRRLHSAFYFEQRLGYEDVMYAQFRAKGGQPARRHPHYAVLGESEIWANITARSLRVPLSNIPAGQVSFTYTDSWPAYVDRDLDGNLIPRKPQYGMLYRLDELDELFSTHGWPGDRWKTESDWEHDLYVEAQIWSDEPLARYRAADGAANETPHGARSTIER
jgi:hypothetical protein